MGQKKKSQEKFAGAEFHSTILHELCCESTAGSKTTINIVHPLSMISGCGPRMVLESVCGTRSTAFTSELFDNQERCSSQKGTCLVLVHEICGIQLFFLLSVHGEHSIVFAVARYMYAIDTEMPSSCIILLPQRILASEFKVGHTGSIQAYRKSRSKCPTKFAKEP